LESSEKTRGNKIQTIGWKNSQKGCGELSCPWPPESVFFKIGGEEANKREEIKDKRLG